MNPNQPAANDLEREVETWNWARAAGVSADELRATLHAQVAPELRKAP
jgi:hypothetical protein